MVPAQDRERISGLPARGRNPARSAAIQPERVALHLVRLVVAQPRTGQTEHHGIGRHQGLRGVGAQRVQTLPVLEAVRRRTIAVTQTHERSAVGGSVWSVAGQDITNPDESTAAGQRQSVFLVAAFAARHLAQRAIARAFALGGETPAFGIRQLSFTDALAAGNEGQPAQREQPKKRSRPKQCGAFTQFSRHHPPSMTSNGRAGQRLQVETSELVSREP